MKFVDVFLLCSMILTCGASSDKIGAILLLGFGIIYFLECQFKNDEIKRLQNRIVYLSKKEGR